MEKKQKRVGKSKSPADYGKSLKRVNPKKDFKNFVDSERPVKGKKEGNEGKEGKFEKPGSKPGFKSDSKMDSKLKARLDSKRGSKPRPKPEDRPEGKYSAKKKTAEVIPVIGTDGVSMPEKKPRINPKTGRPFGTAKPPSKPGSTKVGKKAANVYIGLGSNMGDRRKNIQMAIEMIQDLIGKITRRSGLYETTPWGKTNQDPFYNQIIIVNTMKNPRDLLSTLQYIERKLGRERKEKYGPRTIDLDILLFGKKTINDAGLSIPHPEIGNRMFVLVPLMEIAPTFTHPTTGQVIDDLFVNCRDEGTVVLLDQQRV